MKKQKSSERPFVASFAEKAGLSKCMKTRLPRLYYLSGAVTHDPHAKLKFDLAETYLTAKGHRVINPLKVNPLDTPWEKAISVDLSILNNMKDYYFAVLYLSKYIGEERTMFPAFIDIDPPDRQFDSPGKRLEKAIAFGVLPIVEMPREWDNILNNAINEYETETMNNGTK